MNISHAEVTKETDYLVSAMRWELNVSATTESSPDGFGWMHT